MALYYFFIALLQNKWIFIYKQMKAKEKKTKLCIYVNEVKAVAKV